MMRIKQPKFDESSKDFDKRYLIGFREILINHFVLNELDESDKK